MRTLEILQPTNDRVFTIIKTIAITVSVAYLYWYICSITPEMSKSPLIGVFFGKTIKLANILRAFVIVNPYAFIGTMIGAIAFNITTGTQFLGAMPILPLAIAALGLLINKFYTIRTTLMDITVLGMFGALTGILVSYTHIIALLSTGDITTPLAAAVTWKILSSILTVLAGYPFIRLFEKITK